jgi:hypothetical protein
MNRQGLVIAAAVATTLAAGCASTNTQNRASDDEKTYVTGSRIPVKDAVYGNVQGTGDRKSIEDMVRRPGTVGNSSN